MRKGKQPEDLRVLKQLGRQFAEKRKSESLTQAALANQAGVAKRTIERIETGFSVQLATLLKILRVFNLLYIIEETLPSALRNGLEADTILQDTEPKQYKKSRSWGADT